MSLRILVVDDSSTIQKVIKIAFAPYQHQVISAGSYIEALTEIQNQKPSLLIIDANISGRKTLEDVTKLHQEAGRIPILLLRGTYDDIDETAFQAAGFTNILRKPFESSDIVTEVGKMARINTPDSPPPPPHIDNRIPTSPPPPPYQSPGETFQDLSDASGRNIPLPPPVREKVASGIMEPPRPPLPEMSDHLPPPPPPSPTQSVPLSPPPPAFIEDEELSIPAVPTSNMRGQKAFQGPMEPHVPKPEKKPTESSYNDHSVLEDFKGDVADVRVEIARQMREALPQLVREAVESYCALHFPQITREIVTTELRRLAEEKARHLIDN